MSESFWERLAKAEHTITTDTGFCFRFFKRDGESPEKFDLVVVFKVESSIASSEIVEIKSSETALQEFFNMPENICILKAMLIMYASGFSYGMILGE